MHVKIIPDFLPKPVFNQLVQIIFSRSFDWHFTTAVGSRYEKIPGDNKDKVYFMSQGLYDKERPDMVSPESLFILRMLVTKHMYYDTFANYYDIIGESMPEGQFLDIEAEKDLIRIKVNFYPNTAEILEHDYHIDYDYPHRGALLSLNTCDGYTKIRETGEKYPSVANTLLIFDPSKHHCSTTTTDAIGRFNIQINYL